MTTTPALSPASMLVENYCKEQNLIQALFRLCSAGCSNTNWFSVQRQQHKPTSSAYIVLLPENRVEALLEDLSSSPGYIVLPGMRRIPTGFVFLWQWHRGDPDTEVSFGQSWSVLGSHQNLLAHYVHAR